MVAGQGSRDQAEARRLAYGDPGAFGAIVERIEDGDARLSFVPGRGRRGSVPTVRQLGRQPVAGAIRAMGDRADIAARRRAQGAPSRRTHHRISKGCGREARAPMRGRRASTPLGLDETVDPHGRRQGAAGRLAASGQSRPVGPDRWWGALQIGVRRILDAFAGRPHIFNLGHGILPDTPIAHIEQLHRSGEGGTVNHLTGWLGLAYPWVKAAHVTFVIFWMAGLFLLPRLYVYHQETAPGSPEDRAWIEREARVRSIILTPAMMAVWVLGLMLAFTSMLGPGLVPRQAGVGRRAHRLSGLARCLWQEAGRRAAAAVGQGGADAQRDSRHRRGD